MLPVCLLSLFIGLFLFPSLGMAACTGSSPIWNCPANARDIAAAISSGKSGDTINVAAGTIPSLSVTINGRYLIGAGSTTESPSATSGTIIQSGTIKLTKHSTYHSRISGFSFTGTGNHLSVSGTASAKAFIIDHNYIFSNGGSAANRMVILGVNGGLLHHNTFVASGCVPHCFGDVFNIQTGESWTEDPTIGSNDTTGERNIYFEDNTFEGITETAPDGDQRARLVIRYNTYKDSSIVFHSGFKTSGGYSDTTLNGGTRHFEVYNNTFIRVSNSVPMNKWIWVRGATGVIANNSMDRASSPDGSTYPNKSAIRLSVNCNKQSYPMEFQVGQLSSKPDATPDTPLLIFGNMAGPNSDGTADSNFIAVGSSDSGGLTCATPSNYIQVNRDYVLSNSWGWKPYTYPHPLQADPAPQR